ncbi:MAG TPA: hypothetical protein VN368_02900 [Candidatus Methylomirabilis sp.]|nr:hypothetical protein [Candidatus Methylomirabilis sp.]
MGKKKQQLSLAQALGNLNLSGIDRSKLLGRKVFFEYSITYNRVTHMQIRPGKIIDLHRAPGYVIIQDEKGNWYSRSLTNVWGDICE